MSRNNASRLGTSVKDGVPDFVATNNSASGKLDFAVPTEFVTLPSKGKYYPEDHPLYNVEEIEIKHMTAKEEDIIASRSLLQKGLIIDRLIESVVLDKRIKAEGLLIGDKNAIMIAARITGFGSEYPISVACPNCGNSGQHEFDLSGLEQTEGNSGNFDVVNMEGRNFEIKLPHTKATVEVKLLTGHEERKLNETMKLRAKKNLPESAVLGMFRSFIISVNGVMNASEVSRFMENLPTRDSRYLRHAYQSIVPNVIMEQVFDCASCGHSGEVNVPLTAEFFWPK